MVAPRREVAAVVLAAGSSTRMGANKLLLELDGQPLVRRAMDAAADAGCASVLAVVNDDAVASAVADRARIVWNPDAGSGMSSSIRAGLQQLGPGFEAAVIVLADQPLVTQAAIRKLLEAGAVESSAAIACRFRDTRDWTPPVYVPRVLWPHFLALSGDRGAREIFSSRPELLRVIDVEGSALDVDTPADMQRLRQLS